ncbi:MAG: zf-HC2 domain-containing protein [candidate division Zixibacteria bacterium]|nr:zf-HC2 domain-containing protein [candidate division Zixibacteria bacterium]
MTSRHSRFWHGEYLDGEVSPAQKAEIEQHVQVCPECRADLEQTKRLRALLGRIEAPDPGSAYFDALEERITAQIGSQTEADDFPMSVRPVNRGGEILKTLIGLAAVITLLFSSFYLSSLRQEKEQQRWAEKAALGRYVHVDSTGISAMPAEPQTGINSVGSPSPIKNQEDSVDGSGE